MDHRNDTPPGPGAKYLLARRRWAETGLDRAILDVDRPALAGEWRRLRAAAPRRGSSGKRYFGRGRAGLAPPGGAGSPRREERLAIALANDGRSWPWPDKGGFRLLDYQVPLKARRGDKGVGKIDLLGLTDTGRLLVVELKVRGKKESRGDSPLLALVEGLGYAAILDADRAAIAAEAEGRFGVRIADERPAVVLLGTDEWWRGWFSSKAAGAWAGAFETLLGDVRRETDVEVLCLALSGARVGYAACGRRPGLGGEPRIETVALGGRGGEAAAPEPCPREAPLRPKTPHHGPLARTSLTDPLRIAELRVPGAPGRLGLTFCPGKKQWDSTTGPWDRDLKLDLDRIAGWGAAALVTLMEGHELERVRVPGLGAAARARGLAWHHLPIRDVDVPDEVWERRWAAIGAGLRARLARGEHVLIHCRGGLGRAGTVAARLLVEHGTPPGEAIRAVRAVRPGAIETAAQEAYVRDLPPPQPTPDRAARVLGCLLGGACGDALGAPVEFMGFGEIRRRYGPAGITTFDEAYGRVGAITDDTQMTLFTAEGLVRAAAAEAAGRPWRPLEEVHRAYLRWLLTQGERPRDPALAVEAAADGAGLVGVPGLWTRRAPGNTCLSALRAASGPGGFAANGSKGCGGVMRAAPAGLAHRGDPFGLGAGLARLTHGHPSGYLAAGHLASVVAALVRGARLGEALDAADADLARHEEGGGEVAAAVAAARRLAADPGPRDRVPPELGEGWLAEEALAVAVWCASVSADDPLAALALAVNHGGDSDSTGAIAGNIVGALHGPGWIPAGWLARLELRDAVERVAADLAAAAEGPPA